MRTTRYLYIGSTNRLRQRGSLGQVPLGVVELARPSFDDPKVHQRDCAQLASHHGRPVRSVCDRSIKEVRLLDHFRELAATPCQRQPEGGGRYREMAAASRWDAL